MTISAISSFWSLQNLLSPSRRARRWSYRCRRCGIQTSTWQKKWSCEKTLFFVYFENLYSHLTGEIFIAKIFAKWLVTTVRDGRLSESQFTRSLWFFPLFWMFNMPVLSRSNHISECQFRNHQAVEAQTIGCNFRVVNRLHYQYDSSQQWSQVLWPDFFWKALVLVLIYFWKQQTTTWPNVQRNFY